MQEDVKPFEFIAKVFVQGFKLKRSVQNPNNHGIRLFYDLEFLR